MQVASTFTLALEDYYSAVASATDGGTCSINTPSNDILLSEARPLCTHPIRRVHLHPV